MLRTMGAAYQVAQLGGGSLSAPNAFYLATRGAAQALYLEDRIGSIAVGMEAEHGHGPIQVPAVLAGGRYPQPHFGLKRLRGTYRRKPSL